MNKFLFFILLNFSLQDYQDFEIQNHHFFTRMSGSHDENFILFLLTHDDGYSQQLVEMIPKINKLLKKLNQNFSLQYFYCFGNFCEENFGEAFYPQVRIYSKLIFFDKNFHFLPQHVYYREQDVYKFLKNRMTGKTWVKSKDQANNILDQIQMDFSLHQDLLMIICSDTFHEKEKQFIYSQVKEFQNLHSLTIKNCLEIEGIIEGHSLLKKYIRQIQKADSDRVIGLIKFKSNEIVFLEIDDNLNQESIKNFVLGNQSQVAMFMNDLAINDMVFYQIPTVFLFMEKRDEDLIKEFKESVLDFQYSGLNFMYQFDEFKNDFQSINIKYILGVSSIQLPAMRIVKMDGYDEIQRYQMEDELVSLNMKKFYQDYLDGLLKPYEKQETGQDFVHQTKFKKLKQFQPTLLTKSKIESHYFILVLGDINCEQSQRTLVQFQRQYKQLLKDQPEHMINVKFQIASILYHSLDKYSHNHYPFVLYLNPNHPKSKRATSYIYDYDEINKMIRNIKQIEQIEEINQLNH